jgi:pilus assembly protein TadC
MTTAALLLAVGLLLDSVPRHRRLRADTARDGRPATHDAGRQSDPLAIASSFDVLSVCLSAGMPMSAAAAATATSAPPRLGALLRRAADLLALGADPDTVWRTGGSDPDDAYEALTRLARRSASSGSALAQGVADLAEQSRQDADHGATAAAERAGVLIAGPLGLCFLPAFVCLGVVPVVAGLAGDIFGSGLL